MLVHLRKNDTLAQVGAGFGVFTAPHRNRLILRTRRTRPRKPRECAIFSLCAAANTDSMLSPCRLKDRANGFGISDASQNLYIFV
ncbi:hypothetical protein ACFH04_40410 [Streptomyces noboritoensis]|uniref:Uncharacterized protein n=1 Tax=Streptomyces noboritoensis TaxID=67337 RepID=A0ABV6TW03_9ACTN